MKQYILNAIKAGIDTIDDLHKLIDRMIAELIEQEVIKIEDGRLVIIDPSQFRGMIVRKGGSNYIDRWMEQEFKELKPGVNVGTNYITVLRQEDAETYVIADITALRSQDDHEASNNS